ncbi:PLAC8 family protein isoform 2 [Tripterygium wilfordii]|uniref:PLAC8 family protein isoform 2 n=1 Tax=Tripterygium wilfordii TaxID=458696 RepID=A0A7J7DVN5_TRIWF|nr:PLAC8 family protein isoform 2 [Tripterygium wilfordii]
MANNSKINNLEESNPLLEAHVEVNSTKSDNTDKAGNIKTAKKAVAPESGWTANGLPLGQGSVMGEPMGRAHWDSGLCACLGRNDHFCSSDLEVCEFLLVLLRYFLVSLEAWPHVYCMEAMLSDLDLSLGPLQIIACLTLGSCEALNRSCGCCGSCVEDELQRELCESACDLTTHVCCHPCAVCQEGREIRRRLPHPGFCAQPVLVMIPPGEQAMGRGA